MPYRSHYFTEFTVAKGVFYAITLLYVLSVCLVVSAELFMTHPCETNYTVKFENPGYNENPCRHQRMAKLLFLTPDECSFGRRLVMSVIMGGIVGWERREADRPAGIRTMSLVSLGACLFTINSAFAFIDGPMAWDASRISAAIPSGVGFLGAGLIFKEAQKDKETGDTTHVVHGLTTAASLWLSAAIGVACGGELYFAASFAIAVMLVLLRFGPRLRDSEDEESAAETDYSATALSNKGLEDEQDPEQQPLKRGEGRHSIRKRAQLSGIV